MLSSHHLTAQRQVFRVEIWCREYFLVGINAPAPHQAFDQAVLAAAELLGL